MATIETEINGIKQALNRLESEIKEVVTNQGKLLDKLDARYVQKTEWKPVQMFVYSTVALVLMAVFGALLALVIIKGS